MQMTMMTAIALETVLMLRVKELKIIVLIVAAVIYIYMNLMTDNTLQSCSPSSLSADDVTDVLP